MSDANAELSDVDLLTDFERIARETVMGGIVRDPELLKRVYERSAQIRDDARARFGIQDIGVPIIREMRERE
jgi:hypothetical protein